MCFSKLGYAVQNLTEAPTDAEMFLLVLDSEKKILLTTPFRAEQLQRGV